jgi:uncharacterized protein (DUF2147 family)
MRRQIRLASTLGIIVVAGIAALVLCTARPAVADDGDAILGFWLTADDGNGRAKVEITKSNGTYSGTITWLERPTYPPDDDRGMGGQKRIDRENPDPDLATRPIIGLPIVEGFTYKGDDLWAGGTIYDPNNGKTYKCKIRRDGDTLNVRGYIGFSLIGRTTQWLRTDPPDETASQE